MTQKVDREETLKANIVVHSALANAGEYNKSPHFLPENQSKVRGILEGIILNNLAGRDSLSVLDMGCGTGFIINLVHDLADFVNGVDITEAMMAQVDLSPGNIKLFTAEAESTPFDDGSHDLVTAYSFLDHLVSYTPVLEEAFRVLSPGGVFYSDLNPNRYFSNHMKSLEQIGLDSLPDVVGREIQGMLHNGEYYESKFGIDGETLVNAEPLKSFEAGIDPFEFIEVAKKIGFQEAQFVPDWYLGQARIMHEQSFEDSDTVENYLRSTLPASLQLFKYVRFILVK